MNLIHKIKYKLKYFISSIPEPEKWVFIIGCSNSGTTILHAILSKHPQIGSLPNEGQFCTNQLPLNRNVGLKRLWAIPPEKMYLDQSGDPKINLIKLKKQWAARYNDLKRPILIEKSPPNTVRLLWLQANFPNAYFIGIHRNGYAVAEGIRRKGGHPVNIGAKQWSNANKILLEDFKKLKNKLLISYEDLTAFPERTLNNICEFLNVSHLDNNVLKQQFKIQGKSMGICNMNSDSLSRLTNDDFILIEKEASDLLKKLNYFQTKHSDASEL